MTSVTDMVIVGAGPYGLSIAAHLRACGIKFRLFGSPMKTWRENMPKGMFLKSEGFASSLSDPEFRFPLKQFCMEEGIPYHDTQIPVSLETFTAYGDAFQKRYAPELEDKLVTSIDQTAAGFRVETDSGETVQGRRVLLAVGITHFQYVPPVLANLPPEFLSHSSAHRDTGRLRGKNVTIIGAGASAMDLAALLHESGANVTVVARRKSVRFHDPPGLRSLWQRVRYPASGIGPGLRSWLYATAPGGFYYLPQVLRVPIVKRHLGPAASWTVRERVLGHVPILTGYSVEGTGTRAGGANLTLLARDGKRREHRTEHVIAATGYRVNLERLTFLSEQIRSRLVCVDRSPVLSEDFQSSVSGLYFTGVAAANSFGPLLRFAFGADFAARRISSHLAKSNHRNPIFRLARDLAY